MVTPHYVTPSGAGSLTGADWNNAWAGLAGINWNNVGAGDTIYLDGGSVSQSYNGQTMTISKNGTVGNPITISPGQDAGHNGLVVLNGSNISATGCSYIHITGNVNNTQSMKLQNFFDTNDRTNADIIQAFSVTQFTCSYLWFYNVNNCIDVRQSSTPSQNFWVHHCVSRATRGDCTIKCLSCTGTDFTSNIIENNDFESALGDISMAGAGQYGYGPDGVQTGNYLTVRNNVFRVTYVPYSTSFQHTDYMQMPGNYIAIYNNLFLNIGDSGIDMSPSWVASDQRHVYIYNNIFVIDSQFDPFPEYIRIYDTGGAPAYRGDIVIANNLFIDNPGWNNVYVSFSGNGPSTIGCYITNNIFYNVGGAGCFSIAPGFTNVTASWIISNNVYYGSSSVSFNTWTGSSITCDKWILATNETGSTTSSCLFTHYASRSHDNSDYHLQNTDTAARGKGRDMSGWFTTDRDNLTRGTSGAWSIGPFEGTGSTPPPVLNPIVINIGSGINYAILANAVLNNQPILLVGR